jgi:hypothetical protein
MVLPRIEAGAGKRLPVVESDLKRKRVRTTAPTHTPEATFQPAHDCSHEVALATLPAAIDVDSEAQPDIDSEAQSDVDHSETQPDVCHSGLHMCLCIL